MFNPRHPSLNGTRQLLRWKMAIVKQLTLFSVVCLLMNFTEYRMRRLPRKLGRFLRLPMRVPRKSRTQSFKFLTPNLKSSRWVMTSHLIHSMGSSIIIIAKLNLGEKIEDAKVVRKILRSLSESFRAKATATEESKDLDEIKIQELIGSLQTYELGLPFHKSSKSLALKTINERMDDSSEEDDVEKEVAFLAKNFQKFLKMKNSGKSFNKGKFSSPKGDRMEFKNDGKDS